jgi:hypothetical protein
MAIVLTAQILEQPHTAHDYLNWVKGLIAEVRQEPDGLRQIRLRVGLAKNLMEEALPIGLFASHFFAGSEEVEISLKVGSQSYDATVRDDRSQPSGVEFLEVTMASEGEMDYLRMLMLHETGNVSGLGRVLKTGTNRTRRAVTVVPEAVSQQTILDKERRLISDAIQRKVGTTYPDNTALLIAFDDTMSHDRLDNQANIVSVFHEHEASLRSFHSVAVVGLVKGLFLCRARDAAPK